MARVLTVVIGLVALVVALDALLAAAQAAVDQGRTFVPWLTILVVRLRGRPAQPGHRRPVRR